MWTLWITSALAANPYAGLEGDVSVTATTTMTPDAVLAAFTDLPAATRRFEGSCATIEGASDEGVNLTWTPSMMHRRLHVTIDEIKPGRRVDWDLASLKGDLGFYLIVDAAADAAGTTVTLRTPLAVPRWPLRGLFFQKVRPAWARCYASALLALDPGAKITSVTGPVDR